MKKLLLLLAVTMAGLGVSAQDIIVKKNGEEIRAKVEEVGERSIRYRNYSNLTGPIYSIARGEVFVIRYESGARDVITPLDVSVSAQPSGTASSANYAQIDRIVKKEREPLRDKSFYVGPRAEIGYAGVMAKGGNLSGLFYSAGVIAEYLFDQRNPHGLGAGVSYDIYSLDSDFDLNYVNVDLYYVYRPRAHWNFFGGFKFGIPVKSESAGIDMTEITNTTFGFELGAGWATRHFDLGMAVFSNFGNTLDVSESNRILGIKLRVAYRF